MGDEPIEEWSMRFDHFLAQDRADREASIETVFADLARFTGNVLARTPRDGDLQSAESGGVG